MRPPSLAVPPPHPFTINIGRIFATAVGGDPRFKATLNFFARKGYLRNAEFEKRTRGPLPLADVLWTCAHVPELYQLVPAAHLRFPVHLAGEVPADLGAVIRALTEAIGEGPCYHGHPFAFVRRWLDFKTTDERLPRLYGQRVHFRLPLSLIERIKTAAEHTGRSQSDVVGEALERLFSQRVR